MAKKRRSKILERYFFEIYQHADFAGDWAGWRLRGRWLISPDGDRINPLRLRGILFAEKLRPKRVGRMVVADPVGEFRTTVIDRLRQAAKR
jgi:hypothetical protein